MGGLPRPCVLPVPDAHSIIYTLFRHKGSDRDYEKVMNNITILGDSQFIFGHQPALELFRGPFDRPPEEPE